jgi:hypothetical protein
MRGAKEGFKNEAKWRGVMAGRGFAHRSHEGRGEAAWKNEPKVGFVWRASGWRGFGKTNPILREAHFTLRSRLGEKLAGERRFGEGDGSRFGI